MENITVQHIARLDEGFPASGDALAQADDHIRFIKACIKSTFQGLTFNSTNGQENYVHATAAELNKLNGCVAATADLNAFAGASTPAADPDNTGNTGVALTPAKVGNLSDLEAKVSATTNGIRTAAIDFGDANPTLSADGNLFRLSNTLGGITYTTDFGHNTSYCKFVSSTPAFYFGNKLTVNSGVFSSYDEDVKVRRAEDSSYQMTINTSGAVFTHNVTAYSDGRLKEDVEPIENALDTVSKLQGVTFTRIDNKNKDIGFIAQEIEKACPELAERVVGVMDDERQTKHVNYANMVAVLVEAVKELKAEVDELKGGV